MVTLRRRAWGLPVVLLATFVAFTPIASAVAEATDAPVPGAITAWGSSGSDLTATPAGHDYVQVAAGHWHGVALKSDGSLVGWGANNDGANNPPSGSDFEAVAAAGAYGLALRDDGSLAGWGNNDYGQATAPAGTNYTAIAAGRYHGLALRDDGSLVGWGRNDNGEATVPAGSDYVAIAAGNGFSIALRGDGSLVGWGGNGSGQASPPLGSDYVAIAAGIGHGLALRTDGSLVSWGSNVFSQTAVPPGTNFVEIAAGGNHSIALRNDGTFAIWGDGWSMSGDVGNGYTSVGAGDYVLLTLNPDLTPPTDPAIVSTSHTVEGWSNHRNLTVDLVGASDPESGIRGYSYVVDQVSDTVPDTTADVISPGPPPTRTTTQADGIWWYHVRTLDWAGNWSAGTHAGPFKIDRTVPANEEVLTSTSHVTGQPSSDSTVDITWSGGYDRGGSGLDGYSISWDWNEYGYADQTKDLGSEARGITSPPLANGWWWFHVRSVDIAGNWTQGQTLGPFVISTSVPVTSITGGPADREIIATHSTAFSFEANEIVTFMCGDDHDGGGYSPCTSPFHMDNMADGTHSFAVWSYDEDGNASNYVFRTFYVDTLPPTNPTSTSPSHTVGMPSVDRTVEVDWSGGEDAGTGVDGYSFSWTKAPDSPPDTVKDAEQTTEQTTSTALVDGNWWFHLRTRDNAGRWSDPVHLGPFVIGTYMPDEAVKLKGDAAFMGIGITNADASGQTRTVTAARNATRTFVIRLDNQGSAADQFRLAGAAVSTGFKIRYLKGKSGTTDITAQVLAGTYFTALVAPRGRVFVRVVLTVRASATRGSSFGALVTATSVAGGSPQDAVKAVVRVV